MGGDGGSGEGPPVDALVPLVYDQLRALAGRYLRRKSDAAMAPTSIVHEAFLRLRGAGGWTDRAHFCAVAAIAMRQILVDRARRRRADKRGGGWERVTLTDVADTPIGGVPGATAEIDVAALDAALTRLDAVNPRQARIVELRFFGGLTMDEVAAHLRISTSTVEKEWRRARAWLGAVLAGDA